MVARSYISGLKRFGTVRGLTIVALQGTHTALMEQGGVYAKLYQLQFANRESVPPPSMPTVQA